MYTHLRILHIGSYAPAGTCMLGSYNGILVSGPAYWDEEYDFLDRKAWKPGTNWANHWPQLSRLLATTKQKYWPQMSRLSVTAEQIVCHNWAGYWWQLSKLLATTEQVIGDNWANRWPQLSRLSVTTEQIVGHNWAGYWWQLSKSLATTELIIGGVKKEMALSWQLDSLVRTYPVWFQSESTEIITLSLSTDW